MEECTQITLDEWVQWKEDIRRKLAETANNFVYIGFRLKQIRDSGMFGGAADIFEFAQKEYGLSKSTVSRFIAINEKYSEGGNSLELREEFRNFSSAKLSEMLTLPEKEIELINERTTIRAIRELKKFDAEDPEEAKDPEEAAERAWTPLEKCIIDFFREKRDTLEKVMELLEQEDPDYKQAAEVMVPSGQAFHKKGIVFLFLYEWKDGVKYKLMNSPDPVIMEWRDFLNTVYGIYSSCYIGNVWENFYGETVESLKKQDEGLVATSQQKSKEKETEKKQKTPKNTEWEGRLERKKEKKNEKEEVKTLETPNFVKREREEGKSESDRVVQGTDQCELSDRAGIDRGDGETGTSAGMAGTQVPGADALHGAAESGGCEANPELTEAWRKIRIGRTKVAQIIEVYDMPEKMPDESLLAIRDTLVEMAAEVERILMLRKATERNGDEE